MKWRVGWGIPSDEEKARRKRMREQRAERERKALVVLATLKKGDAAVLVAWRRSCSLKNAREWLKKREEMI